MTQRTRIGSIAMVVIAAWSSIASGQIFGQDSVDHQPIKLSDLPHAVTSFGAAKLGDSLYVYGGHIGKAHVYSKAGQTGDLWRLKLADSAKWEKCGTAGPKLQGLALVAYKNRLIRLGGFTAKNAEGEEHDLWSQAGVASFDTATEKWSPLPDLPEPRSSFDAVVAGDFVYVIGGWSMQGDADSQWHKTAWKLNLAADQPKWIALPDPDFQRRALAVAEANGKIYAIGGMQSDGGATRRVDIFDTATNTWKQGPDLVGEKGLSGFGASAFRVGGQLIVTTIDGSVQTPAKSGDEWNELTKLDKPRFFHRMLPWSDSAILMIGGADMEVGKFDDLEVIDLP